MPLALRSNSLYLSPGVPTTVSASGGTEPYVYSVVPGGIGGTINSSTGKYTAPLAYGRDTVRVTDDDGATAEIIIRSMSAFELVANIMQNELELDDDRIWIFNQKKDLPKDQGMWIVIRILNDKIFSNNRRDAESDDDGLEGRQYSNSRATLSIDIQSRDLTALRRKNEAVMALQSQYSQNQQSLNSFKLAKIPTELINLSEIDGAAIPYRFNITVSMQYCAVKTKEVDYFDDFEEPSVLTNY